MPEFVTPGTVVDAAPVFGVVEAPGDVIVAASVPEDVKPASRVVAPVIDFVTAPVPVCVDTVPDTGIVETPVTEGVTPSPDVVTADAGEMADIGVETPFVDNIVDDVVVFAV